MVGRPQDLGGLRIDRGSAVESGVSLIDAQQTLMPAGAAGVRLNTTGGELPAILHEAAGGGGGVIWLSGARGGLNGPAGGLYATHSYALVDSGISSLRLHYRQPNHIPSCAADVMVGIAFLSQNGVTQVALVGHISIGRSAAIALPIAVERLKYSSILRSVTFVTSGAGAHRAFMATLSQLLLR